MNFGFLSLKLWPNTLTVKECRSRCIKRHSLESTPPGSVQNGLVVVHAYVIHQLLVVLIFLCYLGVVHFFVTVERQLVLQTIVTQSPTSIICQEQFDWVVHKPQTLKYEQLYFVTRNKPKSQKNAQRKFSNVINTYQWEFGWLCFFHLVRHLVFGNPVLRPHQFWTMLVV